MNLLLVTILLGLASLIQGWVIHRLQKRVKELESKPQPYLTGKTIVRVQNMESMIVEQQKQISALKRIIDIDKKEIDQYKIESADHYRKVIDRLDYLQEQFNESKD